MKNGLRQKIAFLVFFVLLPVSAYAGSLKWAHFNPHVVSQNATGTADLLCYPEGTFTSIKFAPSWSANELQLENRGAGIYGITLNVADLVNGLASDDINRKFAGYLRVYNNATLDGQFNIFIDVLTPDIPEVIPVLLGADAQKSPHLFNMIGTYDTSLDLITKKFYSYFSDDYDFIAIIYDESRFLNRYYIGIRNDVQNIGLSIFDNSGYYESKGTLQGIIWFPIPHYFDLAESGSIHEIGHRWINYLGITPLNLGQPHWPVSTLAKDIMGFSIGGQGGEGGEFNFTITQVGEDQWKLVPYDNPKTFSDLSLYLMGLIPSNEVGNHIVFLNQSQSISAGAIWSGPVANINGAYIVGQLGERVPNHLNSQKKFRIATILLTKNELASAETMRLYDWFASRAELTTLTPVHSGFVKRISNPFYLATGGRATLASTILDNCTYTISPSSDGFASTSALGIVTVTPSSSSCSWTATSNASWITITSGGSGTGNGTVSYSVAANSGLTRTGTITIGGQTFTITQASANAHLDTVQKIYIGYYQRPADPSGLIYWADRLDKRGGNLSEIIEAFANSAESQALYGVINSSNISTVVNNIYITLFGRPAEAGGLNYYLNGFNAGQFTAATIMLNVLYGAQNEDLLSINNKLSAANLFTMTIDPELDGKNFQVTYAGNGDVIAARNFLALYATSVKVPTQDETTAYIQTNIANPGDAIYMSSLGMSRSKPYPNSQVASTPNWDVKVIDTMRGSAAWQAISAANQFNDPAPAGMEYLLVKIHVKSTYTDNNAHSISDADFRVTGDSLRENWFAYVVSPSPALDANLYAGGEAEGWTTYLVGIGEGKLILIVDELYNYTDGHLRFIALDDGASISVDPALDSITPTSIGTQRSSPALRAQTITTEDWEITVLDVVRGTAAWDMVRDANQFNDPPAVGMEYVAAKLRARYISTVDKSERTNNLYIRTTGNANVLYDNPWVVDPDPEFDATLFPGGSYEGWVVTQVATGETGIMLVIQSLYDLSGVNTRYLSLE
jgi:hypothetical protein